MYAVKRYEKASQAAPQYLMGDGELDASDPISAMPG